MEDINSALTYRASYFCWQDESILQWVCWKQLLEESATEEDHGQLPLQEH